MDDDGPTLIVAPDRADGRPCPHAAFVVATLDTYFTSSGQPCKERYGDWLWVRETGIEIPTTPLDPLHAYVLDMAYEMLADESLPAVEFRIGWATAGCREAAAPGSGELNLLSHGARPFGPFLTVRDSSRRRQTRCRGDAAPGDHGRGCAGRCHRQRTEFTPIGGGGRNLPAGRGVRDGRVTEVRFRPTEDAPDKGK